MKTQLRIAIPSLIQYIVSAYQVPLPFPVYAPAAGKKKRSCPQRALICNCDCKGVIATLWNVIGNRKVSDGRECQIPSFRVQRKGQKQNLETLCHWHCWVRLQNGFESLTQEKGTSECPSTLSCEQLLFALWLFNQTGKSGELYAHSTSWFQQDIS